MPTDAELLHRYVEQHDERAFAELVQRHLGLVYAAAVRRTGGRSHLAEEISQEVFGDLARKAAALRRHPALTGWLYLSTRYAATAAIRAELRRQKLAQSFTAMSDADSLPETQIVWEHLRPVIDQAMDHLKERDREIILLRFFSGLTFTEVGARLNLAENAARMRTERALDRLRVHLGRRGVTSTTAALGLLLANSSLAAAPADLAATVSTAALAAAPAGGVASFATVFLMGKITAPVTSAVLAASLTALVYTSLAHPVSVEELAALRQENARLVRATAAAAGGARAIAIERAVIKKHFAQPAVSPGGHRNRGQATAHDAWMTGAWADDVGDIEAAAKLMWFEGNAREKAFEVLASMPESIRAKYRTPEELYGFFRVATALLGPPPGADIVERFEAVEIRPGRAAIRAPGATQFYGTEYQLTSEGWKYVIPEQGVKGIAQSVLGNEALAKLATP
jgi:RNA polymerase sigma factor (sigma-70 family)